MSDTPIPPSPDSSTEFDARRLELVAALGRIVEPLEQSLKKHDENMTALREAKHMIRKVSRRWLASSAAGLVVVGAAVWLAWVAFGRLDTLLERQAELVDQQAEIIEAQKKASTRDAELEAKLDAIPRLELKPAPPGDPSGQPVVVLKGKTKPTSSAHNHGHPPPAAKPIEVELDVPTKKRRPKKGNPDK